MKKKSKRIGLRGDSKPDLQLVPHHLREASAGIGPTIDPSGLPRATTPSSSSGSGSTSS